MSFQGNLNIKKNPLKKRNLIGNSLLASLVFLPTINNEVFAKNRSYVAVEPLTCDLVEAIALPSDDVICLVDREKDVHDLKLTPQQLQILNNADLIFTLGKEMTPAMKNWEDKKNTVVIGVSAIDIDDHSDHGDHADHDDHSDHDDHADHDEHADHDQRSFEWAGLFDLKAGTYTWSFAKVNGDYADPAMRMVILKSSDIEKSEKLALELLNADDAIDKNNNDVLTARNEAYVVNFEEKEDVTIFTVEIKKDGEYVFFTEHMPFEFEANEHFFKDNIGDDIEPIAQFPEEGHDHHHHDHGGLDPHDWHDPHNIIKMAEIVRDKLKSQLGIFNGGDRNIINARFDTVDAILENLDDWIVEQVETVPESDRVIVSKHKALEYYGDAFGFKIISLLDYLGESSSLRPDTIGEVLQGLKEGNIKVIFVEQVPPSKLMKNLSRQSSVPLSEDRLYVDGLMLDGNILTVAIHNTCTIVNSLGGLCNEDEASELESEWEDLLN